MRLLFVLHVFHVVPTHSFLEPLSNHIFLYFFLLLLKCRRCRQHVFDQQKPKKVELKEEEKKTRRKKPKHFVQWNSRMCVLYKYNTTKLKSFNFFSSLWVSFLISNQKKKQQLQLAHDPIKAKLNDSVLQCTCERYNFEMELYISHLNEYFWII